MSYIHFNTTGCNYSFSKSKDRCFAKDSAYQTIKKIETFMIKNQSILTGAQKEELAAKANAIRDQFMTSMSGLSSIKKYFLESNISKKMKSIEEVTQKINKLAKPIIFTESPKSNIFDKLPKCLFQNNILNLLDGRSQLSFATTCQKGLITMKEFNLSQARQYGYTGSDFTEARLYMEKVVNFVDSSLKSDDSLNEFACRSKEGLLDLEETYKNCQAEALKNDNFREKLNCKLAQSIQNKNLAQVKALLLLGADPNANVKTFGMLSSSPILHLAVEVGSTDCVSYLLKHGGDVNKKSESCRSIHYSSPCYSGGKTPLITAIDRKDEKMVEFLLKMGANPHIPYSSPNDESFPLHRAVESSSIKMVELLLQNGADVNALSSQLGKDRSVLFYALFREHKPEAQIQIVTKLLEQKPDKELVKKIASSKLPSWSPALTDLLVEYCK